MLEKGSEVGAHILSGAVIDPKGLDELFPDWKEKGAPLETPVAEGPLHAAGAAGRIPSRCSFPPLMHNHGDYIASLANLCRWLGAQAEELGVEIYPGFAASDVTFREDGSVKGVVAGDVGIGKNGEKKADYQPGMEISGKSRLSPKACAARWRRHSGQIRPDRRARAAEVRHRLKELWQVAPDEVFEPGLVQHTAGWPLDNATGGGKFHVPLRRQLVSLGFVVHLNYKNPYLSPFDEFQRLKHHPAISRYLAGGKRIAYGARAITEGG